MFRKLLFLLICFSLLLLQKSAAQNLTGIWRGHFVTEGFDQYKFELQIEQSPTNVVSGVSYSYLNTVFYGKATLTGNYNKSQKNALIQEIRTVELRMSGGSVACIMKCQLKYSRSGNEEFLEGTYTSSYEKDDRKSGIMRGGNCGGGKVYLRKVTTSDFYVEPFLRKPSTQTPIKTAPKKTPAATQKSNTTIPKKPPVQNKTTVKKADTKNTNPKEEPPVVNKQTNEPAEKITSTNDVIKPKVTSKPIQIPAHTRSRENELVQTIDVENESITIKLYDNGEIDGDTISVYMDKELVLSNKRLTASPLTINLKLSEENPEHVLVMVAENLGRIPPNTSLMIVDDGKNKYQVRITSTEQKNAMVKFRLKKDEP